MKEFGANHTIAHVDKEIMMAFRPGVIDEAHKRALEYEITLNEFSGSGEQRLEFAREIVDELDENCGHMDAPVVISGSAMMKRIDLTTIEEDNTVKCEVGSVPYLDEKPARSLGYTALLTTEDPLDPIVIKHVALAEPSIAVKVPSYGEVYRSEMFYMPIDGSAQIRLPNEPSSPNVEMLQYYVPDILEDIDDAIFNSMTITQRLRRLSRIPFARNSILTSKGGEDIKDEIAHHINVLISPEMQTLYRVSGVREVILETQPGTVARGEVAGFRATGVVHGVRFATAEPTLMLGMSAPFQNQGLRELFLPLTGRVQLTQMPQISIS